MSSKFAVFDIDGTLIRWQLYHALFEKLAKLGHIPKESHHEIQKARMSWKRRESQDAFRDYEHILVRQFENTVPSLSSKEFDQAVEQVIEEYKDQTYTYTRNLIRDLKGKEYTLLAISGSQTELVKKIVEYYGFDDYVATKYSRNEEGFDGKVFIGSKDKSVSLQGLVKKHGLTLDDSYAVGDSKSDASMLAMVTYPIAFNPDKELFELAKQNHWKVVVERKNMVYELEETNGTYILA